MKTIVALILTISAINISAFSQKIERVEPPNWWVGMDNPQLQILVYGDKISEWNPELDYPGVRLNQIIRVENPNYVFIDLTLTKDVDPGIMSIRFKSGKKVRQTIDYELRKRQGDGSEIVGFDASDVIYLITPDRFINGNPDNDEVDGMKEGLNRGFKGGRHGGDLAGIRQNLDYLQDMGFTAIWLNPVLENDMPTYSYHGYAATDFYSVDRRYGDNAEYVNMIKEAHDRGMKVIMDMIVNHSGSEHWFVKDKPTQDWINFGGEFRQTTHNRIPNQDMYASEYDKKAFADGWFVETMPDLNQRNPLMAHYLIQNAIWWIEYSRIDGIRMDTYPYPDKYFMAEWTCEIMSEYPHFNIVGEEWINNSAIVSYWQRGKKNHDGYTSCLPSLMDFPLQNALANGLQEKETWGTGLIKPYQALAMDFLYPEPGNLVVFPDNHDMDRFYTQVGNDMDLFKMGMVYFATIRGIPQIYYGTEILMNNDGHPGDHGIIRTDFPGGWQGDPVNAISGEGLSEEQKEAQEFIRDLLKWRLDKRVIHEGKLMQFTPEQGIYSYVRYTEDERVLVIFNKNESTKEWDLGRYQEIIGGYSDATDVLSGREFTVEALLELPARSVTLLELRRSK